MLRGNEEEGADDDHHADQVPPDRDVVEDGHQPDAESVEQAVREEDDRIDGDDVRRVQRVVEELVEQRGHEERAAEVDAGRDGDLPEKVEPTGEPAPGRAVVATQLGSPVIQSAGGRVARANFCHRKPDEGHEDSDQRPPDVHDDRPAGVHPIRVQGQTARQDGDVRERHGKVRKGAHPAHELLRVAHPVECLDVGTVSLDAHTVLLPSSLALAASRRS